MKGVSGVKRNRRLLVGNDRNWGFCGVCGLQVGIGVVGLVLDQDLVREILELAMQWISGDCGYWIRVGNWVLSGDSPLILIENLELVGGW